MIYFITNCPKHLKKYKENLYDNIKVLEDNKKTLYFFKEWLINHVKSSNTYIAYDVETNGLDAWMNNSILKMFGDKETQFLFHSSFCFLNPYFNLISKENFTLLGHNIKFDLKFLATENKIYYKKVYDTMIAEQRLYMKSGLSFALSNLAIRYLQVFPDEMDKNIRMEFVNKDVKTFTLEPRHLYYGAGDLKYLFIIKDKQEKLIERYKLSFLIYNIEFPLIHIIAKAELTGFNFDKKNWLEIYNENVEKRFKVELELDKELKFLRNTLLPKSSPNRIFMLGGKWDNKRIHNKELNYFNDDGSTNVLDLFGKPMSKKTLTGTKSKVIKSPNNVNYSSDTQIIEIFGRLGEPLLTDKKEIAIPIFTKTHKVNKTLKSYKTGEPVFHEYLFKLPNSIMKNFIFLLLEYRGFDTACNNFGANFITKLNTITGKLHTVFRQCAAATGRFQSGGGKNQPDKPNFQNIPSKASYAIRMRNCFLAKKGYSIGTHDLSGAELIIMCSLSQDMKLLEISKGDMHSFVAQNSWRRIYNFRAHQLVNKYNKLKEKHNNKYRNEDLIKKINKYIRLSKNFTVSKKTPKIRTAFKPVTFGVIYGMWANKLSQVLNIFKEEAQLIINFINSTFPDVINMVKKASYFASINGYIIHNNRTNSRAWFPSILETKRAGFDFSDYKTRRDNYILSAKYNKEISEARNSRIQGTQADMIKECTVDLQKWINDNNYTNEITMLSWVHDEIVDEHPNYLNGKSEEWQEWSKNNNLSFINDKGKKIIITNFPELKKKLIIETCNRYLKNVTMGCDYEVENFWTK